MAWSHNDIWMLTGDDKGYIKYWKSNMNTGIGTVVKPTENKDVEAERTKP